MPSSPFHNLIGHERVQDVLGRMITHDRLPHAFLFVGPHHLGKTYVAKQLIRFLSDHPQPLLVKEGGSSVSMDVIELGCLTDEKTGKKKTQISVEQVREVCERLAMSAMNGGWKIAFIKDANVLSNAAANALLKTLEEPKGKTLFILRAPSVESVLPTVASRCQVMRFHPVSRSTLATALVKKGHAKPDAELAAAISLGRPGRALRYLTKSEDRSQTDIGVEQAIELFSSTHAKQIRLTSTLLPKEDVNKRTAADQTVRLWQRVLRDDLLRQVGCEELVVYKGQGVRGKGLEGKHPNLVQLIQTLKKTEEGRSAIAHNTNPQLTLEHILFSL
ncbi:MAG: AAA family ATPase [Candidatus Uhrbacteria bacterium]|nr:AAA family ATPase [Candidatus Uhrbacteria bacterium]